VYDRLVGTPPTQALLNDLEGRVFADPVAAGMFILDKNAAHSSQFYTTTLKNFATPWTNRDQTVFAPLNDYTATVIGMVRDDVDFRTVLSADLVYTGQGITRPTRTRTMTTTWRWRATTRICAWCSSRPRNPR
jgi:hypothetical protein